MLIEIMLFPLKITAVGVVKQKFIVNLFEFDIHDYRRHELILVSELAKARFRRLLGHLLHSAISEGFHHPQVSSPAGSHSDRLPPSAGVQLQIESPARRCSLRKLAACGKDSLRWHSEGFCR
jgi:hypothetical protein